MRHLNAAAVGASETDVSNHEGGHESRRLSIESAALQVSGRRHLGTAKLLTNLVRVRAFGALTMRLLGRCSRPLVPAA